MANNENKICEQRKNQENKEWIKQCEDDFARRFRKIAQDICEKRHLRIVRLFGPT